MEERRLVTLDLDNGCLSNETMAPHPRPLDLMRPFQEEVLLVSPSKRLGSKDRRNEGREGQVLSPAGSRSEWRVSFVSSSNRLVPTRVERHYDRLWSATRKSLRESANLFMSQTRISRDFSQSYGALNLVEFQWKGVPVCEWEKIKSRV